RIRGVPRKPGRLRQELSVRRTLGAGSLSRARTLLWSRLGARAAVLDRRALDPARRGAQRGPKDTPCARGPLVGHRGLAGVCRRLRLGRLALARGVSIAARRRLRADAQLGRGFTRRALALSGRRLRAAARTPDGHGADAWLDGRGRVAGTGPARFSAAHDARG